MAEAVILEFSGVGQAEYDAVNAALGVNSATGEGDWPDGLLTHAAGTSDTGGFTVIEVWSSRDAQGAFMASQLGAALQAGGVTSAPKVTWVSLIAYQNPGS